MSEWSEREDRSEVHTKIVYEDSGCLQDCKNDLLRKLRVFRYLWKLSPSSQVARQCFDAFDASRREYSPVMLVLAS